MGMWTDGTRAPVTQWDADTPVAARPARFSAIVLGEPAIDSGARTTALLALGGCVAYQATAPALTGDVEDHAGTPVMILDLTGSAAVDARTLEQVDALAARRDWPLIVVLTPDQIDSVSAICVASRAQLLCEPAMADWIGALAIAVEEMQVAPLSDLVNESEAARLQRLNSEVARIAEVVARLSRQSEGAQVRHARDRAQAFGQRPPDFDLPAARVRDVIRARRLRDRFFDGALFEDPAWDMLLDLLAAHLERAQVSVSSLCIAAAVPPTTALRWITKLSEAGLLEREPDPFDKRRAYMKLASKALEAMRRYVAATTEADLPLV